MKKTKRFLAFLLTFALLLGMLGSAPQILIQQVQAAEREKTVPAPQVSETPDAEGNYALTLVLGFGQEPVIQKYKAGTKLDLKDLPMPLSSGCEFMGWYLDQYLLEPCPDPYIVKESRPLYASYRADGTSFSAYQNNMPWDVEFVLRSSERITEETLKDYVSFEDIYNGTLTISMEEISAQPDPNQPGRELSRGKDGSQIPEKPVLPPPEQGEFRYRLYAEHGFGPGQLYGFTVLQPEKVNFLSAGNVALEGNQATQFNFQIKEEIFNTQNRKSNVKELPAGSLLQVKELGDYLYEGVFSSPRTPGEVIITEKPQGGRMNYKILKETGENTYEMTVADSDDLWEEFALTSTSETMSDVTFDMNQENVDAAIREIETNIGVAAYIDAALDSIRMNPEVMEFMAQVPQEEYDAFMDLRAVDLGYGPLELRDDPTLSVNIDIPKGGSITAVVEDRPDGMSSYVMLEYTSPELTIHMGRNTGGTKGEIHLSFTISEEVEITAKALTIKKNSYPSQKEDYVQTHILPECTTTIKFNADMELTGLHTYGNQGETEPPEETSDGTTESTGGSEENEDSQNETRDSGDETQDSRNETRDSSDETQDSRNETRDSGDETQDSRNETRDSSDETRDSSDETRDSGDETQENTEGTDPSGTENAADPSESIPETSASTDPTEEEKTSVEVEAPWEVDPYQDITTKKLNLAMANHDIYLYIEAMQRELVHNNEYYDVDLNYVPLVDQEIGRLHFSVTGIDSISIGLAFKVELAAKAQFTGTFKYTFLADVFTTNGRLIYQDNKLTDIQIYDENGKKDGARILRSNLNVNLSLKGGVGARTGFALDVNFSDFMLNSLLSVGIEATVGVYLELTGYLAYEYDRTTNYIYDRFADVDAEASSTQVSEDSHFEGGLKIETGIYVDVAATITLILEWKASFLSFEFPLYEKELGAFNTSGNTAVYGDFINSREEFTIQAANVAWGSGYELLIPTRIGMPADQIQRSCKTKELKPLENGESLSTGLNLYQGYLRGNEEITAYREPYDTDYTYRITSLKLDQGIEPAFRNFDGSTHFMDVGLTDTEDISKYAAVSANGTLLIKDRTKPMTIEVLVEAPNLTSVFTQKPPQKVFKFHFVTEKSGESWQVNFHDTDGNFLFTDVYPGGYTPLPLPGPGYTCRQSKNTSYSVAFDSAPPKLSREEVEFFEKNNLPKPDLGDGFTKEDARRYVYLNVLQDTWEGDWSYTAKNAWGYNPQDWDLDSAFWVDENEQPVTAETLPGQGTVNLYLRMKPAYEPQLVWLLNFRNPDRPYYVGGSKVYKAVPYEPGTLVETARNTQDPVLNNHSELRDSENFGTRQTFSRWNDQRGQLREEKKTVRIYNETPRESVEGSVFRYDLDTSIRSVQRTVPVRQAVAATADASVTYLWEKVYFEKDGKTLSVKTNIGSSPAVPAEFDTADVRGWKNSYDGVVYTTPGVLPQRPWYQNHPSRMPVVYTPVQDVKTITIVFDASDIGSLTWNLPQQQEGIWYSFSEGGSWSYEKLADGNMAVHYSGAQNSQEPLDQKAFPPKLKVTDPEFVLPVNEGNGVYRWVSTEKVGQEPLVLQDQGQSVNFAELTRPESGVITLRPQFDTRTLIVKIPGSQEKFGGQEDMGFKVSGKLGDTLTEADIYPILKGIITPQKTYGAFQKAGEITRIDLPKPYVFGSGDASGKQVLVDTLNLSCGWEDTLTLNLNGGSLQDNTTGTIRKQGNSLDTFDLSTLPLKPTMKKMLEDDIYQIFRFAGWQNAEGETVTTAHYGETLTAQWQATEEKYFDLTLNLTAPLTFADGTASKTLAFDLTKNLKSQTGYELPADVTQEDTVYSFGSWMLNGERMSETAAASAFAGKPKTLVAAVSISGDVFDLTGFAGTYDGQPHTVTTGNLRPGVTLLYSEDGITYGTAVPRFTDAGTYTVYVKAMKNGQDAHDQKSAQVIIRPLSGVQVTVTGHTASNVYNGQIQSVSGYDLSSDNPLLKAQDVTFRGTDQVQRKDAGKTQMGLKPEQFTVTSGNFTDVAFEVTDGFLEITRKPVTVKADDVPAGTPVEDLTATVTGTLSGDTVSYNLSLGEPRIDGSQEILCTGQALQGNYQVSFQNGNTVSGYVIITVVAPDGYFFREMGGPDVDDGKLITQYQRVLLPGESLGFVKELYHKVVDPDTQQESYDYQSEDLFLAQVDGQQMTLGGLADHPFMQSATVNISVADVYIWSNGFYVKYDGNEHRIEADCSDPNAVLEFSVDNTENWSTVNPAFKDVCKHTVYIRARKTDGSYTPVYKANAEIEVKPIWAEAPSLQKVYGEPDPMCEVDLEVDGEIVKYSFQMPRQQGEDIGSYDADMNHLIFQVDTNHVYRVQFPFKWSMTISPRKVTAIPAPASKTEGEEDPPFSVIFENTDPGLTRAAEEVVDRNAVSCTVTRDPGEKPGEYPMRCTGSVNSENYIVTWGQGTFTIHAPAEGQKAPLMLDENKNPVPDENKNPVPDENKNPGPVDNKNPVPGDNKNPVPGDDKNPVPGDDKNPVPGDDKNPVPGDNKNPAPGDDKNPVPGDDKNPVPEDGKTPGSDEES